MCQTQRHAFLENTGAIISMNLKDKDLINSKTSQSYKKQHPDLRYSLYNIRSTWWKHRIRAPTRLFFSESVEVGRIEVTTKTTKNPPGCAENISNRNTIKFYVFTCTYLWNSLFSLRLVICHVSPLFGSKPGCEISNPCFLTNLRYLKPKLISN